MAKKRTINALDLFSGAGGFSFGMEQAGVNVVAAIEFDEKIAKTYSFNHKKTVMINDDIRLIRASKLDPDRKTNISSIEEIFNDRNLTVDIIFGGPPCQGFSMAGRRIRKERSFFEDERNLLFLDFIRMVRELRPKVFVIENVPGILNYNGGSVKQEIEKCFEELNYNVKSKVLSAEKFGVPQRRKRAIFIGNNLGIDSEELFPKETVAEINYVTVWDAIGDLPALSSNDGNEIAKHTISAKNDYQKIMRSNDNMYYNHVSSAHKPETIKLLKMIKQGQTIKDLTFFMSS